MIFKNFQIEEKTLTKLVRLSTIERKQYPKRENQADWLKMKMRLWNVYCLASRYS